MITQSLAPILLILYIRCRNLHQQTWGGWSFESLTEWWQFLKLGVPGFLMLAFEWWSFEISTLVSGSIDETQLAINSILIQIGTLMFMVSSIGVQFKLLILELLMILTASEGIIPYSAKFS